MTGILAALATPRSGGASGAITLTDQNIARFSRNGANVTASYTIANDGTVRNHNNTIVETWNSNPGSVGAYEVRATLSGGGTPAGGTLNTWLNCGTSRGWFNTASAGQSYESTLFIEIRDASSLTVLDSAMVSIYAASDSGGFGGTL